MNATFPCCKLIKDCDILDSCDKCKKYHSKYHPTNADRIRQMSDEELAEFLNEVCPAERFLTKTWLEWLKKEVEK